MIFKTRNIKKQHGTVHNFGIKTAKIFGIPECYKEKDYIYYLIHKTIQHAPIDILD